MAGLDPAIPFFVAHENSGRPGAEEASAAGQARAGRQVSGSLRPQSFRNTIDAIHPVISAIAAVTRP